MTTSQVVSLKVGQVAEAAGRALNSESSTFYENFDAAVSELEGLSREAFQAKVVGDYRAIMNKLQHNGTLTEHEHEMLELLIVGGAKYYLKYENDLENWRNELKRLTDEMLQVQAGGLDDIDSLLHLRALCLDAKGVLPDVSRYYREKERVRNFESSTSGPLDAESRQILAEILRQMMESPTM